MLIYVGHSGYQQLFHPQAFFLSSAPPLFLSCIQGKVFCPVAEFPGTSVKARDSSLPSAADLCILDAAPAFSFPLHKQFAYDFRFTMPRAGGNSARPLSPAHMLPQHVTQAHFPVFVSKPADIHVDLLCQEVYKLPATFLDPNLMTSPCSQPVLQLFKLGRF